MSSTIMDLTEALKQLNLKADPAKAEKYRKMFAVSGSRMLGISVPDIRKIAKEIGKDHALAQALWKTGIHEARILATMVGHPDHVTEEQMDKWVRDFDSWDIVDHACGNLFDKTRFAYRKAAEWTSREKEFEKRAGFSLIAYLAVHDKKADDRKFLRFLPAIKREAHDERNFVKKAVNWALREIGKRNAALNKAAVETARELKQRKERSARWIGSDALRELTSEAVQKRLKLKKLRCP